MHLFRLLGTTLFEAVVVLGIPDHSLSPIYYVFNGFLLVLQVLHVIWFGMILRMVYSFLVLGQVQWFWQQPCLTLSLTYCTCTLCNPQHPLAVFIMCALEILGSFLVHFLYN